MCTEIVPLLFATNGPFAHLFTLGKNPAYLEFFALQKEHLTKKHPVAAASPELCRESIRARQTDSCFNFSLALQYLI